MLGKINHYGQSIITWLSGAQLLQANWTWIYALLLGVLTAMGTYFAWAGEFLSHYGWGIYPLFGIAVALVLSMAFAALAAGAALVAYIWRGRPADVSAITEQSEVQSDTETVPVEFRLAGEWLNTPFRCTPLGKGENGEMLYGEDLFLRIVANENLKSASLKIFVKHNWRDGDKSKGLDFRDIFSGNIPRGFSEEILIFRRRFCVSQTSRPNDSGKGRTHFRKRFDLDAAFMDGNGGELPVEGGGIYSIELTVFHENGPAKAFLSLDTDAVEMPRSRLVIGGGAIQDETANNFYRVELGTTQIY